MDLSKLSTEDLLALKSGDLSKVSTEGLMALRGEQKTQNNSLASQAGLFARSSLRSTAGLPSIFTEPLRQLVTDPAARAAGSESKSLSLQEMADRLSDFIGLPKPDTPTQRIVDKSVEFGMGAAGMAKLAQKASGMVTNGARQVFERLAAEPGMQVISGAGAGAASEHAKENGAGPIGQFVSGFMGGVGAPMVAAGVVQGGQKLVNLLPKQQQLVQTRVDQRINVALHAGGIDPATITPAMRNALREQVGRAMNLGNLDDAAVARLVDYTRLNMTPTRGRLTLDPYDVTQEQNASKIAAATGSREARLPQIAQDNNRRLLTLTDEMGGARPRDPYGQGTSVIDSVGAQDTRLRTGVDALYQQARDSSGRSLPLDGAAFTRNANQALDDAMVGGKLPADVANHMNRIARGEVPFTIDYAEQLKTRIGDLHRATADGGERRALGIVRSALDNTPLQSQRVNAGNLPAVQGTVPPSPQIAGQESIDAFNAARTAARQRFSWQESSPAIERALNGANADTFIQNNIISKAAGFDSVRELAQVVNGNPASREAVRTAIVQHLKESAIGRGGQTQTGNFSGRGFQGALDAIGQRKLGLFFDRDEVATLMAMARTGSAEVFQPRGSAVNNSNTTAGLAGLIQGVTKHLGPAASKLPFGEVAITTPLNNLNAWAAQRPAMNVPRGLLAPSIQPDARMTDPLLLPMLYGSGLLAATTDR